MTKTPPAPVNNARDQYDARIARIIRTSGLVGARLRRRHRTSVPDPSPGMPRTASAAASRPRR